MDTRVDTISHWTSKQKWGEKHCPSIWPSKRPLFFFFFWPAVQSETRRQRTLTATVPLYQPLGQDSVHRSDIFHVALINASTFAFHFILASLEKHLENERDSHANLIYWCKFCFVLTSVKMIKRAKFKSFILNLGRYPKFVAPGRIAPDQLKTMLRLLAWCVAREREQTMHQQKRVGTLLALSHRKFPISPLWWMTWVLQLV